MVWSTVAGQSDWPAPKQYHRLPFDSHGKRVPPGLEICTECRRLISSLEMWLTSSCEGAPRTADERSETAPPGEPARGAGAPLLYDANHHAGVRVSPETINRISKDGP